MRRLDEANPRTGVSCEVKRRKAAAEAKRLLKSSRACERAEGIAHVVGERSVGLRRCGVTHAGGIGSANADMSSDKAGEKPARRKPKVSCATFIGAG